MIRISELKVYLGTPEEILYEKVAKILRITKKDIIALHIFKKSLDARKKNDIHYVYVVDVAVKNEKKILSQNKNKHVCQTPDLSYHFPKGHCIFHNRPVVVGFGPAGMFAALILAQQGHCPIVLERGGDVESRKKAVDHFWKTGELDTENNVQFGEGGAGTFSDGKLTTRIKDKRCRKVLQELVYAGAPKEILYDSKPHIGTDLLRDVVKQIRNTIETLGGEVRFFSKVTNIDIQNGQVQSVEINHTETIQTNDVILSIGHSARDTFELLHTLCVPMEQKPFAVGVRIEHEQSHINHIQYGEYANQLPTADYRLTYTTQKGRGVYTFCMCPGGYVVAAASEKNRIAINGMSEYARDGKNANAALLVQVFPEDFNSTDVLAGVSFQRMLEEKSYIAGGSTYAAPIQTIGSFLGKEQEVTQTVHPTYRPHTKQADMTEIFPEFIIDALKEALPEMGKRLHGFDDAGAILTAVESRSSSPVRILRDIHHESIGVKGLYPTGEGAGYAGGIISAAVDGICAAEQVCLHHMKGNEL